MGIRQKLWNWCPKPKKPVLASFTRLAAPIIYISFLIGGLLFTACAAMAFLPSIFFSNFDESEWSPREIERISFLGGDIIVREMRYNPQEKGYISIHIEAYITSEENLMAYVNSRTNALNALLETINAESLIEAFITFKNPINPENLTSLCETSLVKLGEYAIIVTDKKAGTKCAGVLWFPRPQDSDFIQNLTLIREGYMLEGIIAIECYIKAETIRILQSDSRTLLIDPIEDPMISEIKEKYKSMGFSVQVERPFSQEMWRQYATFKYDATDF
ncbi:MAG: hypothetical protein QXL57_01015 [Candidatus Bathyarchaeia archaeon]